MQCRKCGTEIADKAIVCYRCGTPTMEAPAPARRPVRRRSLLPGLLLLVVALGLALTVGPRGPAGAAEIGFALAGALLLVFALLRRR